MQLGTREAWLNAFMDEAKPQFEAAGFPIPSNVRISIGFPSTGRRSKRIGECWGEKSSKDGHFEIFVRPSLGGESRIADVLTHELVHAAVGLDEKHGKTFKRCAKALGLEGKMTATVAGPIWKAWAKPVLDKLGKMPGAPMNEMQTVEKPQTTRMIKCECDTCGFIFRTTKSHIEASEGLCCPALCCDGSVLIGG